MLEKQIEDKVCQYARSKNILAYKFTSPARMGVPDRMFVAPLGRVFFIEFKREGGRVTPAQEREHTRLIAHGCEVHVVDNVLDGYEVVDRYAGEQQ